MEQVAGASASGMPRPPRRRRPATRPADSSGAVPVPDADAHAAPADTGWGGPADERETEERMHDERLQADRPPHHDQGW